VHKFFKKSMSRLKILGASSGRDARSMVRNLFARPMLRFAFVHTWWCYALGEAGLCVEVI